MLIIQPKALSLQRKRIKNVSHSHNNNLQI